MDINIEVQEPQEITPIEISVATGADYRTLENKPQINGVTLLGNKTSEELGLLTLADIPEVDTTNLATKEELNTKQDIISDLVTIRSNANKGATAVQANQLATVATSGSYEDLTDKPTIPTLPEIPVTDVKVNGTSILKDGIANIPAAGADYGVVKLNSSYGIEIANGYIATISASDTVIDAKLNGRQVITPKNLDYAVKSSITTNSIELTEDEKASVQDWIGTIKDVQAIGTSVLADGVANIPLATNTQAGLVRPVQANGIYVSNTGTLNLSKLSDASLVNKNSNYAVLVSQIDLATKVGVTTNTIELTDEEKTNACNWLGAIKPSDLNNYATKTYVDEQIGNTGTSSGGGANVDLSNLSDTGKAVIDGKWVHKVLTIASDVEHTKTDTTYDLSSYLPDDEYDYEVLFGGNAITYTTKGNYSNLYLKTDIIKASVPVCCIKTPAAAETIARTSTTLPVGVGRYIIVSSNSTIGGKYTLHAIAYKRLGTNS